MTYDPAPITTRDFVFRPRPLNGVTWIAPKRIPDKRGWLAEAYNAEQFRAAGLDAQFIQINHSFSPAAGTIRGLHYLAIPQAKHVLVSAGRVLNVCVDVRRSSPTFGQADVCELSAESGEQIYLEPGFAHGICTLEPGTVLTYQLSGHYVRELERGIRWNDAALGIPWPELEMQVSEKDAALPTLAEALKRDLVLP